MELKPCPFCGENRTFNDCRWGCKCAKCEASFWIPDANAKCNWNTRPIEDAQAAEIARLKAEVEAERNRHRAWTDYFQTNQLTHAASRLEAAEDDRRRLKARVAELEGEMSSLRAADEGAVTVEGTWWGPDYVWLKHPGDVESCPRLLRVYELRPDGYCEQLERVSVTIRRRP